MIYTNSISNAVYTILSSATALVNSQAVIELYTIENTNPNDTLYWIGVGQPTISISPWRSNINAPWKSTYSIPMITQVQAYGNVEQQFGPMLELDHLNNNVFTAINSYRTLFNTVNIITGWNISPYDRDDTLSDDFLLSQIQLTAEVFA